MQPISYLPWTNLTSSFVKQVISKELSLKSVLAKVSCVVLPFFAFMEVFVKLLANSTIRLINGIGHLTSKKPQLQQGPAHISSHPSTTMPPISQASQTAPASTIVAPHNQASVLQPPSNPQATSSSTPTAPTTVALPLQPQPQQPAAVTNQKPSLSTPAASAPSSSAPTTVTPILQNCPSPYLNIPTGYKNLSPNKDKSQGQRGLWKGGIAPTPTGAPAPEITSPKKPKPKGQSGISKRTVDLSRKRQPSPTPNKTSSGAPTVLLSPEPPAALACRPRGETEFCRPSVVISGDGLF